MLIIRVITFDLTQSILTMAPQRHRRTDRWTDDLRQQYRTMHILNLAVKMDRLNKKCLYVCCCLEHHILWKW